MDFWWHTGGNFKINIGRKLNQISIKTSNKSSNKLAWFAWKHGKRFRFPGVLSLAEVIRWVSIGMCPDISDLDQRALLYVSMGSITMVTAKIKGYILP